MYTITLVQEGDLETLTEIFSRSMSEADSEKPWDMEHSRSYLKYWIAKQPDMFFIAVDGENNPVGAMAVNVKPWRTGVRLSDGVIFVDPDHQKKGIAKMLFKKALEEGANKHGATSFEAVTFAGEIFPLTWYKKIGIMPDEHAVLIKGDCGEILNNIS